MILEMGGWGRGGEESVDALHLCSKLISEGNLYVGLSEMGKLTFFKVRKSQIRKRLSVLSDSELPRRGNCTVEFLKSLWGRGTEEE
jgi:hypothetical protein